MPNTRLVFMCGIIVPVHYASKLSIEATIDAGESVFNGHTPRQLCRVNSIDPGSFERWWSCIKLRPDVPKNL